MLSVTWASGPPIHMRVPVTVMLSGAKHLLFLCLHKQILRFLESDGLHRSPEIGLRRCAPQNDKAVSDFRRSDAKPATAGCCALKTNNKQILRADYSRVFKSRSALRCAQDDMIIGFYSSLLESRTPVHYHERRNDGVSEGLHQL